MKTKQISLLNGRVTIIIIFSNGKLIKRHNITQKEATAFLAYARQVEAQIT